jgi:hypothetical protein
MMRKLVAQQPLDGSLCRPTLGPISLQAATDAAPSTHSQRAMGRRYPIDCGMLSSAASSSHPEQRCRGSRCSCNMTSIRMTFRINETLRRGRNDVRQ